MFASLFSSSRVNVTPKHPIWSFFAREISQASARGFAVHGISLQLFTKTNLFKYPSTAIQHFLKQSNATRSLSSRGVKHVKQGRKKPTINAKPPPIINDSLVGALTAREQNSADHVQVRLILPELEGFEGKMDITSLSHAIAIARAHDLDLVGVNLQQSPPVVKVLDHAKAEYDAAKALKLRQRAKKEKGMLSESEQPMKEFKFRAGIADNDLERKVSNMKSYLQKGHPCQVTITSAIRYRREDADAVNTTMIRIIDLVKDSAQEPQVKKGNEQYMSFLLRPN